MTIQEIFIQYVLPWIAGGGITALIMWKFKKKDAASNSASNEMRTVGEASEIFVDRLTQTTEHLNKAMQMVTDLREKGFNTQSQNRAIMATLTRHLSKCTTEADELAEELEFIKNAYDGKE